MPRKPLGNKIEKNPEIANQIILWLQKEPKLKSYTIEKRLLENFNFKVSVPTLDKWRKNFLKDRKEDFDKKKEEILESDKHDIDIKYENLAELRTQLQEAIERKNQVKKSLESKVKKTGANESVVYIDTFLEKTFQEYLKMILDIRKEIFKYTISANPYSVVKDAIKKLIDFLMVILVQYKVSKEDLKRLQEFISDLDNEYFTKYSQEKKK